MFDYPEKEIYVIGGGPSVRDYNLRWFKSKDTIAVNKTAGFISNLNYFITLDHSLLNKLNKKEINNIKKNAKKKIFVVNFGTGVLYRNKQGTVIDKRWDLHYDLSLFDEIIDSYKIDGIGYTKNTFRTGNNSGLCALQYAIIKGYTTINLVGIDLNCEKNRTQCHNGYGENPRKFKSKLNEYYFYWKKALQRVKRERPNIKIYSCSKSSRLNNIIPYKQIKKG